MKKVVFITGASTGIGKTIGDFLITKECVVYGTSRNPKKYASNFNLLPLDVSDEISIKEAVSAIIDEQGRIDVLINNAGKGITGAIEETPLEEIKKVFDTNLFGVINVCNAVLPYMRKQRKGLIINVSSIAGDMGLPYRGIYSATKGALSIVSEALRMETKQFGIAIADVAPGDFATNIAAGRYHAPLKEDSPYAKQYGKVLHQINEEVDEGSDTLLMAKAVYKIIRAKKPKTKYRVGLLLQRMAHKIKFILPNSVFEKMLMKQYEI